jgi:hypothetical protein
MSDPASTIKQRQTMPTFNSILRALVVVALLGPGRAMAQRSDADWLDDCRNDRSRERREVYCEVREAKANISAGSNISMEGLRNGGIWTTGWDRNELVVRTRIRVQARTERDARDIAADIRTVISGGTVTVEGPRQQNDDENWTASLVANVPRRSDLTLETRNGPVSVERVSGNVNVRTSNGPLALRDLGGDVRARTTNGPLTISLSGDRWDGAGLDAQTTNGPLTINVPSNYNARLETGTHNGPVRVDFPITVVGRIGRDISTTLGSGGATIRATTTNGPLTLSRK